MIHASEGNDGREKAAADRGEQRSETYPRTEALSDGSLVPVPQALSKEASFRVPVAFSHAAWLECVKWDEGGHEQEEARIYDVLFMALNAIRRKDRKTDRAEFTVHRVKQGERERSPINLIVRVSAGDDRMPVLTVLLAYED